MDDATLPLSALQHYLYCPRQCALIHVEEFRSFLADRLVLSLINRGEVPARGFVVKESGAVFMDDDVRKAHRAPRGRGVVRPGA